MSTRVNAKQQDGDRGERAVSAAVEDLGWAYAVKIPATSATTSSRSRPRTHLFSQGQGFRHADASFPLFVFTFLVALGIDYNIFLMTPGP